MLNGDCKMLVFRRKSRCILASFFNELPPFHFFSSFVPFGPVLEAAIAKKTQVPIKLNCNDSNSLFTKRIRFPKQKIVARILDILASHTDIDEHLTGLNLKLSQPLVVDVLKQRKDVYLCLKFFDWVGRQQGYYHDGGTCHLIFKMLCEADLKKEMLDWLHAFKIRRDVNGVRFYDVLVIGYSVAGKFDIALHLLGQMRFRGIDLQSYTYNVLLNALVEGNCFEIFEDVYRHILFRGFENEVTACIRLKSLCKQERIEEAKAYFWSLKDDDKIVNSQMVEIIVDNLCKQRKFEEVNDFIEEFISLNKIPKTQIYNVWIRNLLDAGKRNGSIEILHNEKLEGKLPQTLCYDKLIYALVRENRLIQVYDLLTEMRLESISIRKDTMNSVLCSFCKDGMVSAVLELYHSRTEIQWIPDDISYNYFNDTLSADRSLKDVCLMLENILKQGYFPHKQTFNIIADALSKMEKFEKMNVSIHVGLLKKITLIKEICTNYISLPCFLRKPEDGYLLAGKLGQLVHSFNSYTVIGEKGLAILARIMLEMQSGGHSWNKKLFSDVICCLCQINFDLVLQLLETYLSHFKPNCHVYNSFIDGADRAGKLELTKELYSTMLLSGFRPSSDADNIMLRCYLREKNVTKALMFFNDICQQKGSNVKLYNSLIVGLCLAEKVDLAWDHWKEMRKKGLRPNLVCYEELIYLLCSSRDYNLALVILIDLERCGRHASSFICNIFLLHSMKSEEVYWSWMRSRHTYGDFTLSSHLMIGKLVKLFAGYFKQHYININSDVFRGIRGGQSLLDLIDFIETIIPVNVVTYNMFLIALTIEERTLDQACQLFHKICEKGFEPNRYCYDILVRGFCNHGKVCDARMWMHEMIYKGFIPTTHTANLYDSMS